MGVVLMGKYKQIDIEVKGLHENIVRSNLVLRQRIHDVVEEIKDWKSGLLDDTNGNGDSLLH